MDLNISEGWISLQEMEFVKNQITATTGNILEVGAANGRLFTYLHSSCPDWKYIAVDPWEQEDVRLQVDWDKGYFDPNNLKEVITIDMFKSNCPYAETHEMYFDKFESMHKYDIISMGLVSKSIDWNSVYKKAFLMLKPNGVIIGRNLTHKRYGPMIKEAIQGYKILDTCKGSFVIGK
jgi:hypothetical protein|tara:strand:+ start:385 stop:918 length:534 start_codon:yes stop_codon:yes gene_type:complete